MSTAAPAGAKVDAYQLNDYELASRLSYFLWSSMPDDELFRLAEEKRLHNPAVLSAQVQRMLQDPKASALVKNFGEQWLNLRLMDRTKPDCGEVPVVDDELLDACGGKRCCSSAPSSARTGASSISSTAGSRIVNGPLARYYGIAGVDGEQFQRVELDGEQRSGIMTRGRS